MIPLLRSYRLTSRGPPQTGHGPGLVAGTVCHARSAARSSSLKSPPGGRSSVIGRPPMPRGPCGSHLRSHPPCTVGSAPPACRSASPDTHVGQQGRDGSSSRSDSWFAERTTCTRVPESQPATIPLPLPLPVAPSGGADHDHWCPRCQCCPVEQRNTPIRAPWRHFQHPRRWCSVLVASAFVAYGQCPPQPFTSDLSNLDGAQGPDLAPFQSKRR